MQAKAKKKMRVHARLKLKGGFGASVASIVEVVIDRFCAVTVADQDPAPKVASAKKANRKVADVKIDP